MATRLGLDGLYVEEDDGNPAWEDLEGQDEWDDNNVEAEARWRANDLQNGETVPELKQVPSGHELAQAHAQVGLASLTPPSYREAY